MMGRFIGRWWEGSLIDDGRVHWKWWENEGWLIGRWWEPGFIGRWWEGSLEMVGELRRVDW